MRNLLALVLVLLPSLAFGQVSAMPSFYDFGEVPAGSSASTTIRFFNQSDRPNPSFHVYCSGDLADYRCFSMCGYLPAFGSCTVQVEFSPRNGDGLRRVLRLNGSGSGDFATSTIYGTDERASP